MKIHQTVIAAWVSLAALTTTAGDIKHYSQQDFDTLAHAGKPVVVDVSAPWCPTCKAQKPIVEGLSKQPAYKDLTILTVDFDSEKTLLKQFKVNMQSTLIAFNGGHETARSVGDATPTGIENIFQKAMH